jgi:hypothetical protein
VIVYAIVNKTITWANFTLQRFEILFPVLFCREHLNRSISVPRKEACLVFRDVMRFLHIRKLEGSECFRINSMTSFSFKPNWNSMASKGVLSSHAIWIIRSRSDSEKMGLSLVIVF